MIVLPSSPANEIRPARGLWWLHPSWAFAVLVGGTMAAALMLSDAAYRLYGAPKYVDREYFLLALAGIAAVAAGQWLGKATGRTPQPISAAAQRRLTPWFYAAAGLSILGYVVWFGGAALRDGLTNFYAVFNLDNMDGADHRAEMFPTVSGVTTCTQFGMAAVLLGLLSARTQGRLWLRRVLLATLFLLAAGRMIFVSERVALIELVAPAIVLVLRLGVLAREHVSPRLMRRLAIAPAVGLFGIVMLFGGAEYFRSWRFYQDRFDSITEFTVWRMSGYYTTSHNNGVMAMKVRGTWPMPYYTLEQFWRFPLVAGSPFSYQAVNGFDPEEVHRETLERFGTVELNNQGGLFSPAMDFGWAGYFVFWSLFGFVAGRLHRGFLAGSLGGLTFYPLVFLSIMEVPRLLYLSSVRSFPTLVLLGVIVALEAWRGSRRSTAPLSSDAVDDAEPPAQPLEPMGALA